MEAAETVLFRFGSNQLNLILKGSSFADIYGNQTAFLLIYDTVICSFQNVTIIKYFSCYTNITISLLSSTNTFPTDSP